MEITTWNGSRKLNLFENENMESERKRDEKIVHTKRDERARDRECELTNEKRTKKANAREQ